MVSHARTGCEPPTETLKAHACSQFDNTDGNSPSSEAFLALLHKAVDAACCFQRHEHTVGAKFKHGARFEELARPNNYAGGMSVFYFANVKVLM